jgi:diadenosine tetraphosphate (Ap4A) HIT family hydrolase
MAGPSGAAYTSSVAVDCVLCRGAEGDAELDVVEVWRDDLWRLTMARYGPTLGFAYLEPIRHIPHLADLDGREAQTFGSTIARVTRALLASSGAPLVFAYVFGGGVPHLHIHLAPNLPDGVLSTQLIEGPVEQRPLPSGATELISRNHPDLPEAELASVIERVRTALTRETSLNAGADSG